MMPGLNYTDEDDKFKLLGNVFEYIENEKVKNILSLKGFRKREMGVKCIKIFFMSVFFNYEISKVIDELNDKKSLRKFAKINKLPTETQVSEYFTRFNVIQYFEMANSILQHFSNHIPQKSMSILLMQHPLLAILILLSNCI